MRVATRFRCLSVLLLSTALCFSQHGDSAAELMTKTLQPASGLKVELFASEPLFYNPVAFSIDEKGRFFISETHRYKDSIFDLWNMDLRWRMADFSFQTVEDRARFLEREFATNLHILTKDSELIRVIEDRDGDGRAETSAVFADGFNQVVSGTAAGILARRGQVWFTCIPDLWRFTYDESAKLAGREVLHTGYGVKISVSGHDLHGLTMGPDGKLYFSVGDRGANVTSKEGRSFSFPDTGAVFRCNPDGTELELFATGLRNPQELAFDQLGNLWTHDNDTSGPDKSRVLHVVYGGDYGWRQSYQFMPAFGPWIQEKIWEGNTGGVLPHSGYGAQGPAGLAFYPGTGLPAKYKNHFFACDFPQGVWSYTIQPKGASYEITGKEKFLWNLGCTDVEFGPDSAVYVSDWGKSYSMPNAGRIYRVFDPAQNNSAAVNRVKKLLADGMAHRQNAELIQLLAHTDMRIRMEAQFELANRYAPPPVKRFGPVYFVWRSAPDVIELLADVAAGNPNQLARLHAIWGLGQIARREPFKVFEKLAPLLQANDPEVRAQTAKVLGEIRVLNASDLLVKALGDKHPRVRFFAATALGQLNPDAVGTLFEASLSQALKARTSGVVPVPKVDPIAVLNLLRRENDADPHLRHAAVLALQTALCNHTPDEIRALAKDPSPAVRRGILLLLRRAKSPLIEVFLKDQDEKLVTEAARAINDAPIDDAMAQLAGEIEDCKCEFADDLRLQFLARTINANFRIGGAENIAAVLNFALRQNVPEPSRIEAIRALADWEEPGPLDRVTGIWRPLTSPRAGLPRDAIAPALKTLLRESKPALVETAVRCARKLQIRDLSPALFDLFGAPQAATSLRVEILQTLAEFNDSHFGKAAELALGQPDATLRAAAIRLAEQLNPSDAARLLDQLLATEKEKSIRQAIFAALGDLKDAAADRILLRELDNFAAGRISPELQLDLIEAAAKRNSPAVQEQLAACNETLRNQDSFSGYSVALRGGSAALGKKIFHERDELGCVRCHSIKGKGGIVGPDLGGIASRRSREFLLESIVFPNKEITPGFENVVITLKNGSAFGGTVKSENEQELVLHDPEEGERTFSRSEISLRRRTLSAMPEELRDLISKRDLRDVIEYLATLK